MINKKCCKCKKGKPLNEFHCSGEGHYKYKCKECHREDYVAKIQKDLKEKYDSGDTKYDLCDCGLYYRNEIPRGNGYFELRENCKNCDIKKNLTRHKRRLGIRGLARLLEEAERILAKNDSLNKEWEIVKGTKIFS